MVGKGRRKTGNGLVENKAARLVCFSKRSAGLFKKVRELSVLTGAHVGVLAFSPAGKPKTFNSPILDTLIDAQEQISSELPRNELPVQEELRPGDEWESQFHQHWDRDTASDWWKNVDVHSMGLEEVRRFKSAILSYYSEKRPSDAMAGEPSASALESIFNPSTHAIANIQHSSPDFSSLTWDNLLDIHQQQSFFPDGISAEFMDWLMNDTLANDAIQGQQPSLEPSFPDGLSADFNDSPFISIPCNESYLQQQWADDWLMNDTLAEDAFQGQQPSLEPSPFLEPSVVSHDLALIADLSPCLSLGFF